MSRYLVFFEAPEDGWHVERESLMEGLVADWPDATLAPASEMGITEMRDLGWAYVADDSSIECWSDKSGLGLQLDGDDELAMRFAAWFRGLVPGNMEVTFCDDMYTIHFNVSSGASAEDIARRCSEL